MVVLDNFITLVRNMMYGDSETMPGWIAIGTSTDAATGSDTALGTEVLRGSCTNGKVSTDIVSYTKTFATTEGNGNDFTEVGAVNAAAVGTFANRKVFPAFAKTASFELRISIYIKSENNL